MHIKICNSRRHIKLCKCNSIVIKLRFVSHEATLSPMYLIISFPILKSLTTPRLKKKKKVKITWIIKEVVDIKTQLLLYQKKQSW